MPFSHLQVFLGAVLIMVLGCRAPASPVSPTKTSVPSSVSPTPRSSPKAAPPSIQREEQCVLPLSEYCTSCDRSYDASLTLSTPHRVHVESGTCGALRYIRRYDMFSSAIEYFDEKGRLVGAVTNEDYPRSCAGGAPTLVPFAYGEVPTDCR